MGDLILHVHATVDIRVTFDPARETRCMKMMVSDYATEVFLSQVVARVLRDAPNMTLELVLLADDAAEKLRGARTTSSSSRASSSIPNIRSARCSKTITAP